MIHSEELIVDLFAGGGGASTGIEAALGRRVDIAVNHSQVALAVHMANHPETLHLVKDVFEVSPLMVTEARPVGLLWASPDCTHFSVAKGDVPRDQGIRSLAWVVVDWARDVCPRVICLENVREFEGWGPLGPDGRPNKDRAGETFRSWVGSLQNLGYVVEWRVLDASEFGAPTRRRRLFVVARSDGEPIRWPEPTHGPGRLPVRTAAECIDWAIPCPSIFGRRRPLAPKTLARIAEGVRRFVFDHPTPFLVGVGGRAGQTAPTAIYSPVGTITAKNDRALVTAFMTKHFGGVVGHPLTRPIGTITAQDHHSLTVAQLHQEGRPEQTDQVRAFLTTYYGSGSVGQAMGDPMRTITAKHRLGLVTVHGQDYQITDIGMRMLEPHELLRAQFGEHADGYDLSAAKTKAGKIRLIGNSVCPDVARAIVAAQFPETARVEMEAA